MIERGLLRTRNTELCAFHQSPNRIGFGVVVIHAVEQPEFLPELVVGSQELYGQAEAQRLRIVYDGAARFIPIGARNFLEHILNFINALAAHHSFLQDDQGKVAHARDRHAGDLPNVMGLALILTRYLAGDVEAVLLRWFVMGLTDWRKDQDPQFYQLTALLFVR
jgi:hypothetical protein